MLKLSPKVVIHLKKNKYTFFFKTVPTYSKTLEIISFKSSFSREKTFLSAFKFMHAINHKKVTTTFIFPRLLDFLPVKKGMRGEANK